MDEESTLEAWDADDIDVDLFGRAWLDANFIIPDTQMTPPEGWDQFLEGLNDAGEFSSSPIHRSQDGDRDLLTHTQDLCGETEGEAEATGLFGHASNYMNL